MILICSDSFSHVLGIPDPAAPPPLSTRSKIGCHERSNDQAYSLGRGQRTIGDSNQLDWLGTSRVLAGPIHVGSLNVTEEIT